MAHTRTSRYISLILRHKPETIGITLDEHGWASVDELIAGVSRTHPLTMESLEEIVRTDEKQRYSFNGDKTLIREPGALHSRGRGTAGTGTAGDPVPWNG